MRCGKVTGQGISVVALSCADLTTFKLHNCPEVQPPLPYIFGPMMHTQITVLIAFTRLIGDL